MTERNFGNYLEMLSVNFGFRVKNPRWFCIILFLFLNQTVNSQISAIPLNFEADSIIWTTNYYPLADEDVLLDIKAAYLNGKKIFSQSYFGEKQ